MSFGFQDTNEGKLLRAVTEGWHNRILTDYKAFELCRSMQEKGLKDSQSFFNGAIEVDEKTAMYLLACGVTSSLEDKPLIPNFVLRDVVHLGKLSWLEQLDPHTLDAELQVIVYSGLPEAFKKLLVMDYISGEKVLETVLAWKTSRMPFFTYFADSITSDLLVNDIAQELLIVGGPTRSAREAGSDQKQLKKRKIKA